MAGTRNLFESGYLEGREGEERITLRWILGIYRNDKRWMKLVQDRIQR